MHMQHYHRTNRRPLLGDDTTTSEPSGASKALATISSVTDSPVVKTAATAAGVFHGYKRTGSILWALLYGLAARTSPVIAGAVIAAQGFGQQKGT